MWQVIQEFPVSGTPGSFMEALQIWIRKPHVINRRLCGAKMLWEFTSYSSGKSKMADDDRFMLEAMEKEEGLRLLDTQKLHADIQRLIQTYVNPDCDRELTLVLRDMIPKSIDKYPIVRELIAIDGVHKGLYFFPVQRVLPDGSTIDISKALGYKIQLSIQENSLSLQVLGDPDSYGVDCNLGYTLAWLQDTLMPKLSRWSTEKHLNTDITSLKLVPVDRYNSLYQELKKKYGLPLVEKWPERTDPQKFVYEDVAIATYLLLLWEDDRLQKKLSKKQSFVDLGCGNGLLVYILESEGHKGLGLDLRRRKIWDIYDKKLNLVEQSITPSDDNLYPDYDWLIGNHSDELTPWIPVMAARSSYECCYFVLPCCPWDFSAKFNQKTTGISQYRSYLNFVEDVGKECGFHTEEDTLRIPSTKRVCFIGRNRSYEKSEEDAADERRSHYINTRCQNRSASHSSSASTLSNQPHSISETDTPHAHSSLSTEGFISEKSTFKDSCTESSPVQSVSNCDCGSSADIATKRKWASNFQARNNVELPRNCISIDSEIKDRITHTVFNALLKVDDDGRLSSSQPWYSGASLPLSEVATMFDKDTLRQLKSECGGLQTLLRNSHHIFRVQGGKVTLRDWTTDDYDTYQQEKRRRKGKEASGVTNLKTKLCYFHAHHPQGCPLDAKLCRFAHGKSELNERQKINSS